MALPPTSVLLEPVTCMPAWVGKYSKLSTKLIASGCPINSAGNAPCDPAAMAAAAGRAIGQSVSLEAYTLARYMQSEVGTLSVTERVAVGQAAINRVRYTSPSIGNINNLLLYRQAVGHPNRGFYGPIHGANLSAPYGRWAATSSDPSIANLLLAIDILNGEIPADFGKGADDQYGPELLIKKNGMTAMVNDLKYKGSKNIYWVGPLPGVNHFRTMLFTTRRDIAPSSVLGIQLIARAITAVQGSRPNWTGLPTCSISGGADVVTSADTAINVGDKGIVATIAGALLAVAGIIAAAMAIRSRR